MRALGLLTLLVLLAIGIPGASLAQGTQPPAGQSMDARQLSAAMTRYYERPIDVARILVAWEKLGRPGATTMTGFLAGLFTKYPDRIEAAAKALLETETQVFIIQGLRLADRANDAIMLAQQWGWPPERIAPITPVQPLASMKAADAGNFDMMWGASFATGDAAYIRSIYEFPAVVAAQPGVDEHDIAAIAIARHRNDIKTTQAILKKYPHETFIQIVRAASALWSLESNSRQHEFVAAALGEYAQQYPKGRATKLFDEVRRARSL